MCQFAKFVECFYLSLILDILKFALVLERFVVTFKVDRIPTLFVKAKAEVFVFVLRNLL